MKQGEKIYWDNDIEMMKYCKYSIFIKNGNELCKEYATYVTTDCEDDGIYNGLKHYGLI